MNSIIHFLSGLIASTLPIALVYWCIHGMPAISLNTLGLATAAFILSIPVHELIHGITCAYMSDNNYKTISYGINWKGLNAFCRYTIPVKPMERKIIAVMPCVVLAMIPTLIGIIAGNVLVCMFAIYNFAGASHDLHTVYTMSKKQ